VPLEALLQAMREQDIDNNEVAVSLSLFFEGNTDLGSIGYNLGDDQPSMATFHQILREIKARPDVIDVLVRVIGVDGPQWPYTDAIYILSSAPLTEVSQWVEPLRPSEVAEGWMYGRPPAVAEPKSPFVPYTVWWD
jgi:hypothetical protein